MIAPARLTMAPIERALENTQAGKRCFRRFLFHSASVALWKTKNVAVYTGYIEGGKPTVLRGLFRVLPLSG
jgi:hypothetical protein